MDSSLTDFFPEIEKDICIAISYGNEDKLHDIDSYKPEYLIPWEKSQKFLTEAIKWKRLKIVKVLLKNRCIAGDTITLYPPGILGGDVYLVKLLLDKDPQFLHNRLEEETLLQMAVHKEIESMVKLLIDYGANVNLADSHGLFPLNYAAKMGNVVILKMLLDSGANVESILDSSLMFAIKYSSLEKEKEKYTVVVRELLNAGANVNFRNCFGRTPLHFACSVAYREAIRLLLDAGANVNASDVEGKVPFNKFKAKKSSCCDCNYYCVPSYFIKHLILLKEASLYLHTENKFVIDSIIGFNYETIEMKSSHAPYALLDKVENFTEKCQKEIDIMKNCETVNGSVFYKILKKLDNSLNSATESEIQLLNTVIKQNKFPLYTVIFKSHLQNAELRRSLLAQAQSCLSSLILLSESKLPFLPEEIRIHTVSYLENSELDLFIKRLELVSGNM